MPKHDSKHTYRAELVPRFALPGSEKVSEYFITAAASAALWKHWPILQLQKMRLWEKNWLMQRASEASPPQTHYIRLQQGVGPSTAPCEPGRDALFLHPTLRQAMDAGARGERGVYSVPLQPGSNRLGSRSAMSTPLGGLRSFLSPRSSARQRGLQPDLPPCWDPNYVRRKEVKSYKPSVKTWVSAREELVWNATWISTWSSKPILHYWWKKCASMWMNVTHSWVYGPKGQGAEDSTIALMVTFFYSYLWLSLSVKLTEFPINCTSKEAAECTYVSPDKQKL